MLGWIPLALLSVAGVISIRNLVNGVRAKYRLARALARDIPTRARLREALSRGDLQTARSILEDQVLALPGPVRIRAVSALDQHSQPGRASYMADLAGRGA